MAFVGMNLDTVKGELPKWQTLGEDLQTVITNVDTRVQEANDAWNGPDSDKFVAEWQGQYRAQLVAAKTPGREPHDDPGAKRSPSRRGSPAPEPATHALTSPHTLKEH
uniref:Uncharacterized protein n=1 Tax=Janibacter limosus TaxID=53458 RepID=A0AC61U490_9MICO|nr:hypothetical protein [Janibacter limosus]